jgi:hypothetical protein
MLTASLHENRIPSRLEKNGEHVTIFVRPEDKDRASEIVREVRDASPPA